MIETNFNILIGVLGWVLTFFAILTFIYVAAKVAKQVSSPTTSELILFIISVILEGIGFLFLLIWGGVL